MNDNFKIICRTCMLETYNGKMLNEKVFIRNSYIHLSDIIMHCAAVEITMGDDLPFILCGDCVKNAVLSYLFRQKCEESDHMLREILIQEPQPLENDDKLLRDMDDGPSNDGFPDSTPIMLQDINALINKASLFIVNSEFEQIHGNLQGSVQKLVESTAFADQDHDYIKKLPSGVSLRYVSQKSSRKISQRSTNKSLGRPIVQINKAAKPLSDLLLPNVWKTIKEDDAEYICTVQKSNPATESRTELLSDRLLSEVPNPKKEDAVCRVCLEDLEPNKIKEHITTHKEFRCLSCNTLLANYNGLRAHQLYFCKFTAAKDIESDVWFDLEEDDTFAQENGTFPSGKASKKIEKLEKLHYCKICGNIYDVKSELDKHYNEDHLGDGLQQYVCDYCGRILASANGLRTHLRIHTGERPFPCLVCDKAFIDKGCLTSHMLMHTPLETRELYECAICGHKNRRKGNLRIHLQTHAIVRPFKCIACSKEFKTRAALKKHTLIHSGRPRIHVCETCGKGFDKRDVLKNHIKLHTGERPHKCEVCGKGFIQRYTLREHYKSRHPHAYLT